MINTRTKDQPMNSTKPFSRVTAALAALLAFTILAPAAHAADAKAAKKTVSLPAQRSFASADDAAKALAAAMRGSDVKAIYAVLGPGSGKLIFTGDKVADAATREQFTAAYDKSMKLESAGDAKATLLIGENDYPFPYPLVKRPSGWQFDASTGSEEIVNRRIGANELAAIQVCLAYVDAQREYGLQDWDKDGMVEYAQKLSSTPGKHDGLFWPAAAGEPESPLGPLGEKARSEGYAKGSGAYHGYHYRILTAQGKDARGGAYDYIVNGNMIGGFALVAWPARWGVSGVMTFICNHDGVVYQKNLGANTPTLAAEMKRFNPDATWTKVDN